MVCANLIQNIGATKFSKKSILGYDYTVYTFIASITVALGFLSNNVIPIIGGMIISPILSPFYVATAQSIIQTGSIISGQLTIWGSALAHHLLLMLICLFVGFISGIINHYTRIFDDETEEMVKRSQYKTLSADFLIALVCGLGIAFATVRNDKIVQVGFAIAITILPPMVNNGLYCALAFMRWKNSSDGVNDSKLHEYGMRIRNTIILTFINVFVVCLASYITYYLIC